MTSHESKAHLLGVRRAINLHTWPGRGTPKKPTKTRPRAERLSDHPGLILVAAAAARHATPECWGLGIALRFVGRSVTGAFLVVDDETTAADPALRRWARRQRIRTPEGNQRVEVITRRQLCDPDTGVLTTTCYGTGWLFTADEGRSLGLLAEHHAAARRKGFVGGFTLGLPGWGEWSEAHSSWRAKLHRPKISAKALGAHGLRVEFAAAGHGGHAPEKSRAGKWERVGGRSLPFRGRIVDLVGPAFTFDGIDTSDLSEHLGAFGLPAHALPAAVTVDPLGAKALLGVARAVHCLAIALDAEAAGWFTTADDQRQGRGVVGLRQVLSSPGSLAAEALRRAGLTPPLVKFATPDEEALDRWAAAGHGGWSTADIRGVLLPVCDIDVRSAYPAAFALLDCWRVLCASRLRLVDVTTELRTLAQRMAAGDLTPLFDPATYGELGLTLAEVRCGGEPWPVELPGLDDPAESRFYVAETHSTVPLPFSWPDVLAAVAPHGAGTRHRLGDPARAGGIREGAPAAPVPGPRGGPGGRPRGSRDAPTGPPRKGRGRPHDRPAAGAIERAGGRGVRAPGPHRGPRSARSTPRRMVVAPHSVNCPRRGPSVAGTRPHHGPFGRRTGGHTGHRRGDTHMGTTW